MSKGLTADQLEFLNEQGYLRVPRLVSPDALQPLIDEFNQIVDHWANEYYLQGRLQKHFADEPFERRLFCVYEAMEGDCTEVLEAISGKHRSPGMFHVMTLPQILDVVESAIGQEILVHPQFNSRAKLPDAKTSHKWHQDLSFLDEDANETYMVNFWLPLVDAGEYNGGLDVLPGSHRLGRLPDGERLEEAVARHYSGADAVCPFIPKGGAILFLSKTIHGSRPNCSDHIRWSLDFRYCDRRLPTGRSVPGFIARSASCPALVCKDHLEWSNIVEGHDESAWTFRGAPQATE